MEPAWRTGEKGADGSDARSPYTSLIAVLETQGDDLGEIRHDALRRLILLPATKSDELRLKAHLAYEEVFRFSDAEGLFRAILADLDGLAG